MALLNPTLSELSLLDGFIQSELVAFVILDSNGDILKTNQNWLSFFTDLQHVPPANYFEFCESYPFIDSDGTPAATIVQRVLRGDSQFDSIQVEMRACVSASCSRVLASRAQGGPGQAIVIHEDLKQFDSLNKEVGTVAKSEFEFENQTLQVGSLVNASKTQALVSVIGTNGVIQDVNDKFCELSGFERGELIGRDQGVLDSSRHGEEVWQEQLTQVLEKSVWRGEVCRRSKLGKEFWLDTTIVPRFNSNGLVEQVIAYHFDITDKVLALRSLKETQAILNKTGELAKIGGWNLDLETGTPDWSDQVYRIHELPIGTPVQLEEAIQFYAPEARGTISDAVQNAIETGAGWDLNLPLITAKGNRIWVRAIGIPEMHDGRCVKLWGAFQDITEQRLAEESQKRLAKRTEIATKGSGIGVFEIDFREHMLIGDSMVIEILGLAAQNQKVQIEEFLARVYPEDVAALRDSWCGSKSEQPTTSVEFRLRTLDGKTRQIQSSVTKEQAAIELDDRVIGTLVDVTEKRIAEERLSLAMRASTIGLWDWHVATGETHFSDTFYSMLGYEPHEFPMHLDAWNALIHPDDWPQVSTDLRNHFAGKTKTFRNEHRLRCKDGSWTWISDVGEVIERDKSGKPVRMVGVHIEIQELKEMATRFELAVSSADAGVWDWSVAKGTFSTNDKFHLMIDEDPVEGDLPLGYFLDRVHPDDLEHTKQAIDAAHESDKHVYSVEFRFRCRDGSYRWLQSTGKVIERDQDGNPIRMVGQQVDVHEDRLARESIEQLNEDLAIQIDYATRLADEAKAANRAKSQFLANMSHEIRTPMTAILGFAETLAANVDGDDNKASVEVIRRNGEHLLRLINDILDLSKIEAGKFKIEAIKSCPHEILAEVLELMQVRADSKALSWDVGLENEIPLVVVTDPTRLRQILINLSANAIKFTEVGSIKLSARYFEMGSKKVLEFKVRDTGIGISHAQLDNLFQPFMQADSSMSRKFGGTGLGLTISKRFAKLLGGDLEVESKIGEGSCFTVAIEVDVPADTKFSGSLRSAKAAREKTPAKFGEIEQPLQGTRLLFVEDGPDNQRLIGFVLKRAGAEVTVADNGKIGFDLAMQAMKNQEPFDLILMDMQMPILDGYQATSLLRENGCDWPIVALTAHAMASDREKCLNAGCSDYATKPINRRELIATVHRQLSIKQRS